MPMNIPSFEAEKPESSTVSDRQLIAPEGSAMVAPSRAARGGLSQEEEAKLVAKIIASDQRACAKLVALFRPRMMCVASRFMRCEDDCDDAVQDALISAFKAIGRFEANSRLSSWLHRITVNSCLMKMRRDSSHKETFIEDLPPSAHRRGHQSARPTSIPLPATQAETDETCALVRQAIDELPPAYRTVILLRDIEQMDTATTAARLETTENNVKYRLRRARRALHSRLGPVMTGESLSALAG